jgi:hypothetical protein
MLKLEKMAKTLEISMTFKPRERLFDPLFLKALAIAILLHTLAGFLVHIRHNLFIDSPSVFPPAVVDTDPSLSHAGVIAHLEADDLSLYPIPRPKETPLPLPTMPLASHLPKPEILQKGRTSSRQLFTRLSDHSPLFEQQWLTGPEFTRTSCIHLSGALQNKKLLYNGLDKLDLTTLNSMTAPFTQAIYEVRLDTRSGTLFWFKPLGTSRVSKECESILKRIQFEPEMSGAIVSGEVSIVLIKES